MSYATINRAENERIQQIAEKIYQNEATEKERNELAKLIYPKLKFFIWKFCKNECDTEEALQFTLKKIFKNLSHFDSTKARFSTWIYTIARNETLYYLFMKNKENHADIDDVFKKVDQPDTFEIDFDKTKDFESIYDKAIELIFKIKDESLRDIAIDKMIKNLKVKQIADSRDMNENTVKTKLRKIRSDLRREMIKDDPSLEQKIKILL